MCLLNKLLKNSSGITLVEVLASIVILPIISIIIVNIFIKGNETASNIPIDTELRDEADLIMSKFIQLIYSTNQNTIVRNTTDANGSYIEITNDLTKCKKNDHGEWIVDDTCKSTLQKIGFQSVGTKTNIVLKNENYSLENNNIEISPDSKIVGDPKTDPSFQINLVLEKTNYHGSNIHKKELVFQNNIQPLFSK